MGSHSRFYCKFSAEAETFDPMSRAASPDVTVADSLNEHIFFCVLLFFFFLFLCDFIPHCHRLHRLHRLHRRGSVGGFSHPLLREACSIVQLLMMIVMMACPSLIRNSTPLIKGPGAPVLMAAGPSPRVGQQARGGETTPVAHAC